MSAGRRRLRAAVLVSVGAAVLCLPLWLRPADAQTGFVGYLFTSDSNGIDQTGGSPGSAGYPQQANETAHTSVRIDTGPNGHALASTHWPGDLVANFGSLLQVFGAPPEAGQANYPVRAEASSSGQQEATAEPGMSAKADGPTAEAVALFDGYDGGESMKFGNIDSRSTTALEGELGVARAATTITDFTFGGQITIRSIKTSAAASTDGTNGKNEGSTLVEGLEVAGQPAWVDETGVHAGEQGQPNPADAAAQLIIDQVLSHFKDGMQVDMRTTRASSRSEGPVQEYRSGALAITVTLGDPSGDGGVGTFVMGGSHAYVEATGDLSADTGSDVLPSFDAGITDLGTPPTPAAEIPLPTGDTGPTSPVTAAGAPVSRAAPDTPFVAEPARVARFAGVGFAMPFFILLGSLLIGRGLHDLHRTLVGAPASMPCLAERESP